MQIIEQLEVKRVALQRHLDSTKTKQEKNKFGQFATPLELATEIVKQAKLLLDKDLPIKFLDPAFGTGSFYSALLKVFPRSSLLNALAYEIDADCGQLALNLWKETDLTLNISDFTSVVPPKLDSQKANLIICNPPYVRHHHIDKEKKQHLARLVKEFTGLRLSGYSGLYCYFLLVAHQWLTKGGLAGWLIPSEFMYVNYGREIREFLCSNVTLLHVHQFNPLDVQFSDALVSSSVVWFKNVPPLEHHSAKFTYGGSLAKPDKTVYHSMQELRSSNKWNERLFKPKQTQPETQLTLSDLFTIKRGLATGYNKFFILSPDEITKYRIPQKFLIPILPSPRFLKADKIESDKMGHPLIEQNLFLLSCDLPESKVKDHYPSLWAYYQMGIQTGASERYLCKNRSPWYSQESRNPAKLICTYMGRKRGENNRPFRFILNLSDAVVTNTYLNLYLKPALNELLEDNHALLRLIWQKLNTIPVESLTNEGRVYGGGLHKIEPKELGNISADNIVSVLPEEIKSVILG